MNTFLILCATVIASHAGQNSSADTHVAKPVPVTMEIKGDIALMLGYERFLDNPRLTLQSRRDA